MLLSLLVTAAHAAEPVMPMIDEAAAEFDVPRDLLAALAWKATRMDPDARSEWGGLGPMDLRPDRNPSQVEAAALLGLQVEDFEGNPDDVVRGVAALLAHHGAMSHGGAAPSASDLEAWADAVNLFSDSADPLVMRRYRSSVYELVWRGVDGLSARGEAVRFGGVPVDLAVVAGLPPIVPALPDYDGAVAFVGACSDNYTNDSRAGFEIDTVVIHTMEGYYEGAISWFQNCSAAVSAHYAVRSDDGEITQTVAEADIAWHAGHWDTNVASIGIEHEGYISQPEIWYTDAMYQASADLVKDILTRTDVLPDRSHIIGHFEVPGCPYDGGGAGCHTDPGDGWDWDYYMSLIEGTSPSTGTLIGIVADTDIFTGAHLASATVTLTPGGTVVTADANGLWSFDGLGTGTWTATATAPGYAPGSCTKEITGSGQFWCSIALGPDDGSGTTGSTPPGGTTPGGTTPGGTNPGGTDPGGTASDPGETDDFVLPSPFPPRSGSPRSSLRDGGCHHAPASHDGFLVGLVGALAALILRRR